MTGLDFTRYICSAWLAAEVSLFPTLAHGDKLSAGAGPSDHPVRGCREW